MATFELVVYPDPNLCYNTIIDGELDEVWDEDESHAPGDSEIPDIENDQG